GIRDFHVTGVQTCALPIFSNVGELVTGERFLPKQYREQVRIEEYIDILKYTRALRGFAISQQTGNDLFANYFKEQMQSTMYGARSEERRVGKESRCGRWRG